MIALIAKRIAVPVGIVWMALAAMFRCMAGLSRGVPVVAGVVFLKAGTEKST